MSKRLLISEEEKKEIKKLYNIDEGWLDDAVSFLKDTGEKAYDYIKDLLDFDEDSKEKDSKEKDSEEKDSEKKVDKETLSDKDFSEKDKEKVQNNISDLKSKELSSLPDEKIKAKELFDKLNLKLNNKKLSVAIVANAVKESGLNCAARGDGGSYAQKYPDKNIGGFCSFGLWQYNICGGLGIELVKKQGLDSLKDCDKQIDFMINHVKKKMPGKNSIKGYIDWFVDNVERPKDRESAKKKRNQWASSNLDIFNLDVESIHV